MTRHESAFETDDPLLIDVGRVYRAWLVDQSSDIVLDIQNVIAPYLSKPDNWKKGLPTNIGYEQTPEQKRKNINQAIERYPVPDGVEVLEAFEYTTDPDFNDGSYTE